MALLHRGVKENSPQIKLLTSLLLCSIFNIETLYTYHINGDVIDYNVSALENDSIPLRFSGPGPMFITTNRVYFQLFITNTSVSKIQGPPPLIEIGMRGEGVK